MTGIDDLTQRISSLAARPEGDDRERDDLERTFAVIVRLALRNGSGRAHVVQWVRKAYDRLAGPNSSAPPVDFAPQITRLLFARILERLRPALETRPRHWSDSIRDE
jgi:hypothetical protein